MAAYRKRIVRGKARWDVTITRRGAPRMTRTFPTRSLGERWAMEEERSIARGSWRSIDLAERMTVGALLDRYENEELPRKRSVSTVRSAIATLKDELGTLPVIALDGESLAKYRDRRLKMNARGGGQYGGHSLGRKVTSETVRKEMSLISRVINIAIREWGIYLPAGNPIKMVKLPPGCRARDRRLTNDELTSLILEAKKSRSKVLSVAIELAVETAMRRGELVALRWDDVDLEQRVAKLHTSKNGEARDVPLSSRAVEALKTLPRSIKGGPVLGHIRGDSINQSFQRLCRRVGIEDMRWHDLRHEATTRLVEKLGGDIVSVSAITGHKTLQMLKRYTHPRAAELARRLG